MSETATSAKNEIVARPARYYRMTRFLMVLMLVGGGLWFAYDGYIGYPRENALIEQIRKDKEAADRAGNQEEIERLAAELSEHSPHTGMDLFIQRALGYVLPPAGIALLIWALYNSRGVLRLSGDTVEVPGHPVIPLESIKSIDRHLWDKKGIAYLEYEVNGQTGSARLDDFIYERDPTDDIFKRVGEHVNPAPVQEQQEVAKAQT